MIRGWVYIIINQAMPDLVKIGYSTKDPIMRAQELNNTGSPHPYIVAYDVLVHDPKKFEHQIHETCKNKREGKEWFNLSVPDAIVVIRNVTGDSVLLEKLHNSVYEPKEIIVENDPPDPTSVKNDICQFPGCNDEAVKDFGELRYCIWHFRELCYPSKKESIRLLHEEQRKLDADRATKT